MREGEERGGRERDRESILINRNVKKQAER